MQINSFEVMTQHDYTITLAMTRPPNINILESSLSTKKCPAFQSMYDIVSHFTGRNENLCQSCIFSNICHSLISYIILTLRYNTSCIKFSIQKSQAVHKLEEVVFPKNIILLTQKIFILTQMPLKSKSKISLSTRDTVQCFPRQYPYNVTGSFTIFIEKCDDG